MRAKIKEEFGKYNFNGILASEHDITDDLYNPIACLLCCSKGIAIFDEAESQQKFNPNVAYELGMMHLLGRDCKIFKHSSLKVLHSDILMKLYLGYNNINEIDNNIKTWLNQND
jgi:hypothetical protein